MRDRTRPKSSGLYGSAHSGTGLPFAAAAGKSGADERCGAAAGSVVLVRQQTRAGARKAPSPNLTGVQMNRIRLLRSTVLALSTACLLVACDRGTPAGSSAPAASSAAPAPEPMPSAPAVTGLTPKAEDATASGNSGVGPSEGTTAIGGVTGQQDAGGAKKGGSPAPTGGDGASAPAK